MSAKKNVCTFVVWSLTFPLRINGFVAFKRHDSVRCTLTSKRRFPVDAFTCPVGSNKFVSWFVARSLEGISFCVSAVPGTVAIVVVVTR